MGGSPGKGGLITRATSLCIFVLLKFRFGQLVRNGKAHQQRYAYKPRLSDDWRPDTCSYLQHTHYTKLNTSFTRALTSDPMCLFCQDLCNKILSDHGRELGTEKIYDTVTKIIHNNSLDETDTERLVEEHMEGVHQLKKCLYDLFTLVLD